MKPDKHFRDAHYWQAKAPPFPFKEPGEPAMASVVIRFPLERTIWRRLAMVRNDDCEYAMNGKPLKCDDCHEL